jgi:dolichyl-phosphate beta-glucosyltransferase
MSDAPTPGLSLIIPAYNEQQRLPPHLGHALEYLREHFPNFELMVVDDGSTDLTAEAVSAALAGEPRARLISYHPNRGKGYAIRTGVLASHGEVVVFLDADFSTPVEEIPRAIERLQEADIVVGSRDLPGAEVRPTQPFFRRFASGVFDVVKHLIVGLWDIKDTQCGFKAYAGPIARPLFALGQVDRFMFDVEILCLAERAGLRICEMPVQWADAPGSKVRFWEGLVSMIRDLWRIRRLHARRVVLQAETEMQVNPQCTH